MPIVRQYGPNLGAYGAQVAGYSQRMEQKAEDEKFANFLQGVREANQQYELGRRAADLDEERLAHQKIVDMAGVRNAEERLALEKWVAETDSKLKTEGLRLDERLAFLQAAMQKPGLFGGGRAQTQNPSYGIGPSFRGTRSPHHSQSGLALPQSTIGI